MDPIHWFPGHMAKARREMSESLSRVDAVIELVDARLPQASANPMLSELIGRKARALVMTRTDMADPLQTERWRAYFRAAHQIVASVDARAGTGIQSVLPALEKSAASVRSWEAKRGVRPRPLRAMVVGIPNVGKSSLINRLAGRAAAKTGDRPGITQSQQWIRMGKVDLLDTPGVLWPKLDDQQAAFALAISGAIKASVVDLTSICSYFLLWCERHYPGLITSRYQVTDIPTVIWSDAASAWAVTEPVLAAIAERRGLLQTGGAADVERAAEVVLREARTGVLGKLTFEWPDDVRHGRS